MGRYNRPMARLLTALCALALCGLLLSLQAGSRAGALLCKPLASAAFIAVALALGARGAYGRRVLLGLCLAAGGDVALLFPGAAPFLAGLVLFLLGHLCYVAAAAVHAPPHSFLAPAAGAVAALSAAIFAWLWPQLGAMRGPVLAYVIVITVMVSAALAAGRRLRGPRAWLLPAGAVLFYLSDITVAYQRFVAPSLLMAALGLPAYYLAQILLAWSVGESGDAANA